MITNYETYNWNPVYRFVVAVKRQFAATFGEDAIEYKNYDNMSFFEYWVNRLDIEEYKDIIKYLKFSTKGELLLIRYAKYSEIFDDGDSLDFNDFWDLHDGFYRECRSIVIDCDKEAIVLCPFKKFMNLNECEENFIDNIRKEIESARTVEISNKLDGSMQSANWYNGKLIVSGSQAIDPEQSWRLQDGIRMLNENPKYIEMISYSPSYTFIFEYISLKDAHVVKYKTEQEGMYLIGIRNNKNGEQLPYDAILRIADFFGIKSTWTYNKTFNDVLNDIQTIRSDEQEGFVLNIDGHMVKVKGDDYIKIHGILSKYSSPNIVIKNIADGTFDDLVAKVPDRFRPKIEQLGMDVMRYIGIVYKHVKNYYELAPKDTKKDFMIWVTYNVPNKYQAYVRNMYLGVRDNYLKSSSKTPKYKKYQEILDTILDDKGDC